MGTPYRTRLVNGVLIAAFQRITTRIDRGKFRRHKGATSLFIDPRGRVFFFFFLSLSFFNARNNWITPCQRKRNVPGQI